MLESSESNMKLVLGLMEGRALPENAKVSITELERVIVSKIADIAQSKLISILALEPDSPGILNAFVESDWPLTVIGSIEMHDEIGPGATCWDIEPRDFIKNDISNYDVVLIGARGYPLFKNAFSDLKCRSHPRSIFYITSTKDHFDMEGLVESRFASKAVFEHDDLKGYVCLGIN